MATVAEAGGATVLGAVVADAESVAATPAGMQLIADAEAAATAALGAALTKAVADAGTLGTSLENALAAAANSVEVAVAHAKLSLVQEFKAVFAGKTATAVPAPPTA